MCGQHVLSSMMGKKAFLVSGLVNNSVTVNLFQGLFVCAKPMLSPVNIPIVHLWSVSMLSCSTHSKNKAHRDYRHLLVSSSGLPMMLFPAFNLDPSSPNHTGLGGSRVQAPAMGL